MPDNMESTLHNIRANLRLNEGPRCLDDFLAHACLREGISVKELAHILRLPVPVTSAIKNECKRQGVISVTGSGIRLTPLGRRCVAECLRYGPANPALLRQILDAPEIPLGMFEKEIETLAEIYKERPPVDVTVDQSLCTAETGIKRALLMLRAGGLIGKSILFAGDDDLTSVAVSIVLKTLSGGGSPLAQDITVLDVDARVLSYIGQVTQRIQTPVRTIPHDLRAPLPAACLRSFDAVFTDPPYTAPGLILFISRGIQALKQAPGYSIYLAYGQKDPDGRLAAQRVLAGAGLVIRYIYESFNQYHGAQILGGVSDLFVLATTGETNAPLGNAPAAPGPIYTNELNRSTRVFECKNCRAAYSVGHGETITAVEQLKESGCAACGGKTFIRRERRTENK